MTERLYDLVSQDRDGTLLNSVHEITSFTHVTLKRTGKVIALCTGRYLSE